MAKFKNEQYDVYKIQLYRNNGAVFRRHMYEYKSTFENGWVRHSAYGYIMIEFRFVNGNWNEIRKNKV